MDGLIILIILIIKTQIFKLMWLVTNHRPQNPWLRCFSLATAFNSISILFVVDNMHIKHLQAAFNNRKSIMERFISQFRRQCLFSAQTIWNNFFKPIERMFSKRSLLHSVLISKAISESRLLDELSLIPAILVIDGAWPCSLASEALVSCCRLQFDSRLRLNFI